MRLNGVRHRLTDRRSLQHAYRGQMISYQHSVPVLLQDMWFLTNIGFKPRTVKSLPSGTSPAGFSAPLAKSPVFYIRTGGMEEQTPQTQQSGSCTAKRRGRLAPITPGTGAE
ncbi:hypothetical protein CesoFtcFv8_018582 [Champsocephalus esox]|uniref:Uncharacterized protein n=2 Tax=Champsocephalus TaxID=52236 RepID=A0AAN8D009_CHAGU|nr:hypothetical protein CesoFtcFv8_018582 [Champsocephalus esox]KAK5913871.1 hypothetical protein CgunFtcFv8_008358 [Champsocephalus gunnari]